MPSRVNPMWVCYQDKGIKEHSHQEVLLPSSLTGRNVRPVGFKISSRYVDRRTIPNPVYRPFITPPFKKSYKNAINNMMAYFNEIETLFSYWKILPNVLGLSSQIREWIYSATLHIGLYRMWCDKNNFVLAFKSKIHEGFTPKEEELKFGPVVYLNKKEIEEWYRRERHLWVEVMMLLQDHWEKRLASFPSLSITAFD